MVVQLYVVYVITMETDWKSCRYRAFEICNIWYANTN